MVILSISSCPPSLRGDLSKWLNEINTGVYIGKLSARVREELWKRICENIKDGQATMVFSASNAQGYAILVHNTAWKPVDYDGITLMKRPLKPETELPAQDELKEGFSKAAKYEKAKRIKKSNTDTYIILDLETTGLDPDKDYIIEIGVIKVVDGKKADGYQCYVRQEKEIPEKISGLTGISNEELLLKGIDERKAVSELLEFIGGNTVLGYNIKFDISFINKACERHGIENSVKKTRDVMALARRKIEEIENYRLETVAKYFKIETKDLHRALSDCELVYRIYSKLNEI